MLAATRTFVSTEDMIFFSLQAHARALLSEKSKTELEYLNSLETRRVVELCLREGWLRNLSQSGVAILSGASVHGNTVRIHCACKWPVLHLHDLRAPLFIFLWPAPLHAWITKCLSLH